MTWIHIFYNEHIEPYFFCIAFVLIKHFFKYLFYFIFNIEFILVVANLVM